MPKSTKNMPATTKALLRYVLMYDIVLYNIRIKLIASFITEEHFFTFVPQSCVVETSGNQQHLNEAF